MLVSVNVRKFLTSLLYYERFRQDNMFKCNILSFKELFFCLNIKNDFHFPLGIKKVLKIYIKST